MKKKGKYILCLTIIFSLSSLFFLYNNSKVVDDINNPDVNNSTFLKAGLNIISFDLGGESLEDDIRENGAIGDATIIEQNGNYLLIDTGTNDDNDTLINFLKANNINKFDIYISHYHSDHYGKTRKILYDSYFTVEKLYVPHVNDYLDLRNEENEGKSWYKTIVTDRLNIHNLFADYCNANNVEMVVLSAGDSINIGEARLDVIWDNYHSASRRVMPDDFNTTGAFINNLSLVSMLSYKNKKVFFGGDIERKAEELILESGIYIKADIMKFSHHGSPNSNIPEFINAVNPKYGFFPNNYEAGHNHILWYGERDEGKFTDFVNRLDENINLASTLYNGNIYYNISTDGDISVNMTRNYSVVTISYVDENNDTISDSKRYIVNNKSKSHILKDDYSIKIKGYRLNTIDNEIDNDTVSQDINIICRYENIDIELLLGKDDNIVVNDDRIDIKIPYNYILTYGEMGNKLEKGWNDLVIKNASGNIVTDNNEVLGTGSKIILYDNEYTIVVSGDVNQDGKISSLDYIAIRNHLMENKIINSNDILYKAADMNNDNKISALDYVRIRNIMME